MSRSLVKFLPSFYIVRAVQSINHMTFLVCDCKTRLYSYRIINEKELKPVETLRHCAKRREKGENRENKFLIWRIRLSLSYMFFILVQTRDLKLNILPEIKLR